MQMFMVMTKIDLFCPILVDKPTRQQVSGLNPASLPLCPDTTVIADYLRKLAVNNSTTCLDRRGFSDLLPGRNPVTSQE